MPHPQAGPARPRRLEEGGCSALCGPVDESEAAGCENVSEEAKAIAHDPVDPELEEFVDRRLVVDRPYVHRQACPVRGRDEPCGHDWNTPSTDRYLDAVGTKPTHEGACGGQPGQCNRLRPHRRARPPSAERTNPTKTAVRERSNTHAIPGAEPVWERPEGPHAYIRLGVNVDPGIRPAREDRFAATGSPLRCRSEISPSTSVGCRSEDWALRRGAAAKSTICEARWVR
jgi:hypothetical protein